MKNVSKNHIIWIHVIYGRPPSRINILTSSYTISMKPICNDSPHEHIHHHFTNWNVPVMIKEKGKMLGMLFKLSAECSNVKEIILNNFLLFILIYAIMLLLLSHLRRWWWVNFIDFFLHSFLSYSDFPSLLFSSVLFLMGV